MQLSLDLCPTLSRASMVRAAQLCLTLYDKVPTILLKAAPEGGWQALLSARQQHQLMAMALPQPKMQVLAPEHEQLGATTAPSVFSTHLILLRTADNVPRVLQQNAWLWLIQESQATHGPDVADFLGATCLTQSHNAPLPPLCQAQPVGVASCFLADVKADPHAILYVSTGDTLRDMAALTALLVQCDAPIIWFDVYQHRHYFHDTELFRHPRLEILRLVDADRRALAFRRCCVVVHGSAQAYVDDHFVVEAQATGAKAAHRMYQDAHANGSSWSVEEMVAAVQAAYRQRAADEAFMRPQSWATVADALVRAINPKGYIATTELFYGRARVTVRTSMATATLRKERTTVLAMAKAGAGNTAEFVPTSMAEDDERGVKTILEQSYSRALVDMYRYGAYSHRLLIASMARIGHSGGATELITIDAVWGIAGLMRAIKELFRHARDTDVDIVQLAATPNTYHVLLARVRSALAALGASEAGDELRMVFRGDPPTAVQGPSTSRIGVAVAARDIGVGMLVQQAEAIDALWLGGHDPNSSRGHTFFAPFAAEQEKKTSLISARSLTAMLKSDAIDALVVCSPVVASMRLARASFAQRPIPIVGMLHSIHPVHLPMELMMQLLTGDHEPMDFFISPSVCGKKAFVAQLTEIAHWLNTVHGAKVKPVTDVEIVPYGIDTQSFAGAHKSACKEAKNLRPNSTVIVSVGRFSRHEKADLLPMLLATKALIEKGHDITLVLAGGGLSSGGVGYYTEVEDNARKLGIHEHVVVEFEIDLQNKMLILGAADIFVTLSENVQETYGLSVVEAMAAQLPVVASAWNGYRELVVHRETGFLTPTLWGDVPFERYIENLIIEGAMGYSMRDLNETVAVDIDVFIEQLEHLIVNRELRHCMGKAGQKLCQNNFDIVTQGEKMARLICERARRAKAYGRHSRRKTVSPSPYIDRYDLRFAHYAEMRLTAEDLIEAGPMVKQMQDVNDILALVKTHDVDEAGRIKRLLKRLEHGPLSVAAIVNEAWAMPNLLRAMKYGLLRRYVA